MPLFVYSCENKHVEKKFHRQAKDAPAVIICPTCNKDMKKMLSSPSSSSKITIDNGIQAKSVEITPDIIEINEARANKNYREE